MPIGDTTWRLSRPAVSPDGLTILFEARRNGRTAVVRAPGAGETTYAPLDDGDWNNRMPAWRPDGQRIAFSSDRDGSFDIWEIEPANGGIFKRSFSTADAGYPTYSHDGAVLAWTECDAASCRLLVAHGMAAGDVVHESVHQLTAPSFRPDGTLLTFVENRGTRKLFRMLLPQDPGVVKTLVDSPGLADQAAIWIDRGNALISIDGTVAGYRLGHTGVDPWRWTAWVTLEERSTATRRLSARDEWHRGRYVIRLGRLFDAGAGSYQTERDILVENERIQSVSGRSSWPRNVEIIDYSGFTALPGLIVVSREPADNPAGEGLLLAMGVTSLAALNGTPGRTTTGPAQLPTDHVHDIRAETDATVRAATIAAARADRRIVLTDRAYPDVAAGAQLLEMEPGAGRPLPLVSGTELATLLAPVRDASLEPWEIERLSATRQARLFNGLVRDTTIPDGPRGPLVPATAGTRLLPLFDLGEIPLALGVHSTMGQLTAGGMRSADVLRLLTLDTALTLGFGADLGSIEPGKLADIVIVAGDPVSNVSDTLNVVAIIRRGRFMTVEGIRESLAAVE